MLVTLFLFNIIIPFFLLLLHYHYLSHGAGGLTGIYTLLIRKCALFATAAIVKIKVQHDNRISQYMSMACCFNMKLVTTFLHFSSHKTYNALTAKLLTPSLV